MQADPPYDYLRNETPLDHCRAYVRHQLEQRKRTLARKRLAPPGPAITISYQTGSGEHEVAQRLAGILQAAESKSGGKWTVFDRQLVEKVLEEHHLPKAMAKYLPEDRRSHIKEVMEELLGVSLPSWMMAPQVAETVLHLADAGRVILVGRGANFITARMPNVFHVRLIAALPKRIARVQEQNHLTRQQATEFVTQTDRGHGRYVKAHFHARAEDDLLYHLIINTDRLPCPAAALLIAEAAREYFQSSVDGQK